MHRLPVALLLLPVLAIPLWADDEGNEKQKAKPKTTTAVKVTFKAPRAVRDDDVAATKGQEAFDLLAEELEEKMVKAGGKAAARAPLFETYSKKFLDHATAFPKDSSAVDALVAVLTFARAGKDDKKDSPRAQAIKRLEKDFVGSPAITPHLRRLVNMSDELYEVVKEVAKNGADKRTKALAFRAMIGARNRTIRTVEALAKNEKMKASYEKSVGKEKVAAMVENAPKYKTEIKAYRDKLTKGDLKGILADLSIGAPAPETVALNLKGEKVKLSDLKGKVVVLDFWATWCGPCKAMIPQSTEMVKEMAGKPFELVGISVDDERETVVKFHKKTAMPWTHWWVGRKAKQLELWDVEGYPTVYVIDHKGVIRYMQLGYSKEDKIGKVVQELVEEAEKDKKLKTD